MADIFIRHSAARAAEAADIANELADLGFGVWWDTSLVPTGSFGDGVFRSPEPCLCLVPFTRPTWIAISRAVATLTCTKASSATAFLAVVEGRRSDWVHRAKACESSNGLICRHLASA